MRVLDPEGLAVAEVGHSLESWTFTLSRCRKGRTYTMRVLIADDHDLFRAGLRNLLEEQGLSVIGETSTGAGTVELARDLLPDVVVMDLNMPTMSGVEATRRILEVSPSTNVVILALSDEDSEVTDAILAGACGYLLKDASIHELVSGVRAAARGETA